MVNKVYFSALAIGLLTLAGGTNVKAFELLDRMTLVGCGSEPVCSADPCCALKVGKMKMLKDKLHSMFHKLTYTIHYRFLSRFVPKQTHCHGVRLGCIFEVWGRKLRAQF